MINNNNNNRFQIPYSSFTLYKNIKLKWDENNTPQSSENLKQNTTDTTRLYVSTTIINHPLQHLLVMHCDLMPVQYANEKRKAQDQVLINCLII